LLRKTKDKNAQWKEDKAEKAQSFAAAATATYSSNKKDDSYDEDEFDQKACMSSFIESWTTSQKNKKDQKNKRKRSNNYTSDSDEESLQSFKNVPLECVQVVEAESSILDCPECHRH
jgi:predicted acyl esterase